MIAKVLGPLKWGFLFVFLRASIVILAVPGFSLAGINFPYDCSIGGEVYIPAGSSDILTASFLKSQATIQSQATAKSDRAIFSLRNFHKAFCAVENNQEMTVDQLVDDDELIKLVESLIHISSRQDIRDSSIQSASIAAKLALQLSSHISDHSQSTSVRLKAVKAHLKYAVIDSDAAVVDAFFDEQVSARLSQKKYQKAKPYTVLEEIKKELGDISIDDLAQVNSRAIQRALYSFAAKFPEPEGSAAGCSDLKKRTGTSRALLVGVQNYDHMGKLRGAVNDINLLKKTLEIRGFEDIRMAANVTRDQLITQMRALVTETECGDSILFHFSGMSQRYPVCARSRSDCALRGWDVFLALVDTTRAGENALYAAELSQFITAIRNRGADVSMIIDTSNAAGLNIVDLQKLAVPSSKLWTGRMIASVSPINTERDQGSITSVQKGAGDYAVFYAAGPLQLSFEHRIKISEQDIRDLGYFTYAVSKALQTSTNPTVRELHLSIDKEYLSKISSDKDLLSPLSHLPKNERPRPVLDASMPDMRFYKTREPMEPGKLEIEILSPKLTRGVGVVKSPKIKIIGRLMNQKDYAHFTIDLMPVKVASNGQFSVDFELAPGKNEIQFVAIDYKYVFYTKKIRFELSDGLERLAGTGNKYALIIGNKDYIDGSFRDLTTPHRDAEVIGNLLRDRYGFKTTITLRTGSVLDLTLLNATERQIQSTIRLLKNRLTENDTLIIYYAGHGVYQKDIDRAYWLPVDAEHDADYTWIKATDLTDTLKQFTARNILIVADSCYSGAMAKRDVPELKTLDENRRKALQKAATRKSRILMSSGGTEPVLDSGGGNHSVFAYAFITALKEMDKVFFSSQEIYSQYIYPMVQGKENQEPQHKELEQSGHEGGDVIFWRTDIKSSGPQ